MDGTDSTNLKKGGFTDDVDVFFSCQIVVKVKT